MASTNAAAHVGDCRVTLPLLVVPKHPPMSLPVNAAPNQLRIVTPPKDDNKLPLPAIGRCHGKTARLLALLVSTRALLQRERRAS